MELYAAGEDYRSRLETNIAVLRRPFGLLGEADILPFNPVVSCKTGRPRIAFIGLNAYCSEADWSEALRQDNFLIWCQKHYNQKLFKVMNLWQEALLGAPPLGVCLYYTNFVKLVLRQTSFKAAKCLERVFTDHPEARKLFDMLAQDELAMLKAQGCRMFVCFGWTVFTLMQPNAEKAGVSLTREYHFSRYKREHTNALIEKHRQDI